MRKICTAVLAVALLCLGTLGLTQIGMAQTPRRVAVHAGHLLDVKSGKLLADQTLVIEDGRIISSGAAAEVKVPADAVRVDLPNATVLPGLIDAHTHLTFDPNFGYQELGISITREKRSPAPRMRGLTLLAGFTTVRNVGADGYTDVALRDAINAGDVAGPRMLVSGPPWASPAGIATTICCPTNITPWAMAWPTASQPCSTRFAKTLSTAPI